MKIEEEIKQQAFSNVQQKAAMNILFTANLISGRYEAVLKPLDISLQQLNVLSILKGQPKHTANVKLIKDRMIDRMPNVSRLVNKLMDQGLVTKDRDLSDQRVVYIKLTKVGESAASKGRELFDKVSYEINNNEAELLNELLTKIRE